jgi:hypothetical protein
MDLDLNAICTQLQEDIIKTLPAILFISQPMPILITWSIVL